MNEKLILVLSEHRTFGWKFNIYLAQTRESGSLEILGTPSADSVHLPKSSQEELELIRLIAEISDVSLMKKYSRQTSSVNFCIEVKPETIERFIRPAIEIVNYKVFKLAQKTATPIYLREDLSSKILFERYRIQLLPSSTQCLFNFIKDETGLRYFISLTNEGKDISLQHKQYIVLSDKPSLIVLDKVLHFVEKIDSKKLSPFVAKGFVAVPPASEAMYIKSFVIKTMQNHEVRIEGLGNKVIEPKKKAIISLEEDFNGQLTLLLFFEYENQRIGAHLRKKTIVGLDESSDNPQIYWYDRDLEWENSVIKKLEKNELQLKEGNRFYIYNEAGNQRYDLIEWINSNPDIIGDFKLEQNLGALSYYTGTIEMQSQTDEKIDWFDLDVTIIAGSFKIPFSRFRKHILTGNKEFLLPDNSIFILPENWFSNYYDFFLHSKDKEEGSIRVRKMHQSVLSNFLPENKSLTFNNEYEKPEPSEKLEKLLRPYQKEGFYWLELLYRNGFGGCLADDMGLGKTLQTITLLQYIYTHSGQEINKEQSGQLSLFEEKNSVLPASLVVAPTSLLHNWQNELKRFAPNLKVYIYAGNKRLKTKDIEKIFNHYQVIITSYGTLRKDIDYLIKYTYHYLILDESQYIKNPESLLYKSVKQVNSEHRLVLTGTPIENSLADLWAQFNFINEGLLGNFSSFKKNYIQKIVKEQDKEREAALLKLIQPFLLRRTKEEVTPELPPLSEEIIYCDMTEAQEEVYTSERNSLRVSLLETKEQAEKNNFIALQGLTRLRQLANHPALVRADYTEDSGKFEQILMSFETLKASGHKVLIFSSFVTHLKLLAEKFKEQNWKYAMLTGQTQNREQEIERFTNNNDINCFFISLKAGGTGLNLTVADYVFIIDPWWNPAAEMQALSRAHRIGQVNNVMAYRFISSNTIEEKIIHLQEKKSQLSSTFITSNNPLDNLNMQEIEELFN